jgi:hypothetical protein
MKKLLLFTLLFLAACGGTTLEDEVELAADQPTFLFFFSDP